ncbi:uncharacterized protein LOC129980894 [Argiope bruennichi]|uniref:E3 SUMO-protein ligase NSE2 n=1 Tax=Argiope bruennichi TaxID=94029 RepID=A0A8T0G1U0_ARGBR|nr:uncharacterized protein LOC129980894 [Argiope bruennichi]KAF8796856.1 E3 SUMO-protein ligase NSE2 like protein [Argiope bruennichi]
MSVNNVPSVRFEAEELHTVNSILVETFTKCDVLKSDLVQYSPNPKKDLLDLREKLVDLAEMQKDVAALITTIETVESEVQGTEDVLKKLNFNKVSKIFDKAYKSALKEQYTNEDVENMICAVDTFISNKNSDVNTGNEELVVTATKESYLDPLTKCPIKDPVKSKTCHHNFERNTILKYLQKNSRCPYSGCVKSLSREDLVEDLALKRKLLNMKQNPNK